MEADHRTNHHEPDTTYERVSQEQNLEETHPALLDGLVKI